MSGRDIGMRLRQMLDTAGVTARGAGEAVMRSPAYVRWARLCYALLPNKPGEPATNKALGRAYSRRGGSPPLPRDLTNLPRPLIWIERYLTFEADPLEFALVDFAFWRPRPAGVGTDGRVVLGSARREPIIGENVGRLVA
jgi:hypothetical protein